jgi:predicted transcriptional regulator
MSEKEVAILSFPTLHGKFDYLGFTSKDDETRKWCNDLFMYYWERAEPKHELTFARPYKAE